jgi:hypothetical protein
MRQFGLPEAKELSRDLAADEFSDPDQHLFDTARGPTGTLASRGGETSRIAEKSPSDLYDKR